MTELERRKEDYFSILRWAAAYKVSESCKILMKDM